MSDVLQKLQEISLLGSPCGFENQAEEYIKNRLVYDKIHFDVDKMNNIIVESDKSTKCSNILITAHMDEPCFIVTEVCENGYLKFDVIGNTDPTSILSKKVACGKTKGVISAKAIHLLTKDEREKNVDISKLFIDIGARDKEAAQKKIIPGDYFVFDNGLINLGNDSVTQFGLNDKISFLVLLDVIEYFKQYKKLCFNAVFTVQKHLYNRGMKCVLNSLFDKFPIDLGIVIDCIDLRSIDKDINDIHKTKVYISAEKTAFERFSSIFKQIERTSKKTNVDVEFLISKEKTNADAFIARNRDIPVLNFMTGVLNKNTISPILNISGIEKLKKLIIAVTEDIAQNGIQ